jgi:hypothetical protein
VSLARHLGGREPHEADQPRFLTISFVAEHGHEVHGRSASARQGFGRGGAAAAAAAGLDLPPPGLVGFNLIAQRRLRGVALLERLAEVVAPAIDVADQPVHGREAHPRASLLIQINLLFYFAIFGLC